MKITKPTLVLNKTICLQNIEVMQSKAKRHNLQFRPHFKTHQSIEIAHWYRQAGIKQITVSSVQMAEYFASDGWNDITIAFPLNILEICSVNALAKKVSLNICIDSIIALEKLGLEMTTPTGVFIEISTGYARSGINSNNTARIDAVLEELEKYPNLVVKGFLTHAGHTYEAKSKYEVQNIHFDANKKMSELKSRYISNYPDLSISIGDTPSCSLTENFSGIDEIRPGNFIFYDLMQQNLGACNFDDIALRMHCPVVSKQRIRNEIVIYGGAIHFSKDYIVNVDGKPLYGRVILGEGKDKKLLEPTTYLSRLSQEHGILRCTPTVFNQVQIGDLLEIVPVHACLTAHAMGHYVSTKGELIEMMSRY